MNNEELLKKLEKLYQKASTLKDENEVIEWASEVLPLLNLNSNKTYYIQFQIVAHEFPLNLSYDRQMSNFRRAKSQIQMAIQELKLKTQEEQISSGKHFEANSQLTLQKSISKLICTAQKSFWFCDPYMDHLIVEEIGNIPATEIYLLTSNKNGIANKFKTRINAAKKQFTNKDIQVKIDNSFHDRYFILDEKEVWTLGTSYNKDAGKKPTSLNKIISDVNKHIETFKNQWKSATSIL